MRELDACPQVGTHRKGIAITLVPKIVIEHMLHSATKKDS